MAGPQVPSDSCAFGAQHADPLRTSAALRALCGESILDAFLLPTRRQKGAASNPLGRGRARDDNPRDRGKEDGMAIMDVLTSERGIDALIACQPADCSLQQALYADPAAFERDVARFLQRHWLCAGHASSVSAPGDYVLFELAAESVIIVRGQDGVLRAFANVCRHRGSRICAAPAGNSKYLVCPYHGWTYGLNGALRAARHMAPDFDAASHGLKPVQLRVIQGIMLVCLAADPPGLGNVTATLDNCFGPYGWENARIAHRETYAIAANWKLAVENYLECYHCAPSHPEYSKLHALEQPAAR